MAKYQKCTGICGEIKEINSDNFYKRNKSEFQTKCKLCNKKSNADYRNKNKEELLKKKKEYYKTHQIILINDIFYRTCINCNKSKELNLNNFAWRYKKDQIYQIVCKDCDIISKKEKSKTINIIEISKILFRKCSSCHVAKELNNSNFNWMYKDEQIYNIICKICDIKKRKQILKIKNIINKNGVLYRICCTCKKQKELNNNNFCWYNKSEKIYIDICKICKSKQDSKSRKRPEAKAKKNKKQKERKQNDLEFKFIDNISKSVSKIMKSQAALKNNKSTRKEIKFTYEEWALVRDFYFALPKNEWMTEFNQGNYDHKTWSDNDYSTRKWQIDHIIPKSDIKFDSFNHPNFNICFNLFNLRPYSAKNNISDGGSGVRHNKFDLSVSPIFKGNNFNNFLKTQNIPDEKRYELLDRMYEFVEMIDKIKQGHNKA